ncbi:MAG: NAD(P)/FAD-dependent oxidoreductase [Parvibaculaceae bacterium]
MLHIDPDEAISAGGRKVREVDVIIVGGGPAGSSCAWRLRQQGRNCLVLDRAEFPRLKLCAGWITPQVVRDLEIDPASYPLSFLTFQALDIHIKGWNFKLKTTQHSIRRVEFDAWLLERSGAEVVKHNVKEITWDGERYVIDGVYAASHLVGAGGTRCPVHRTFFRDVYPRENALQAAVLEEEFPYEWKDGSCHLWFFEDGVPGYSWYVPKAGGHLNVGIGANAAQMKGQGTEIRTGWRHLEETLNRSGLVTGQSFEPAGYTYYARNDREVLRVGNAYLAGDSAGLATRDMFEGIGPAVASGIRAADSIAIGRAYELSDVPRHSLPNMLAKKALEHFLVGRALKRRAPAPQRATAAR